MIHYKSQKSSNTIRKPITIVKKSITTTPKPTQKLTTNRKTSQKLNITAQICHFNTSPTLLFATAKTKATKSHPLVSDSNLAPSNSTDQLLDKYFQQIEPGAVPENGISSQPLSTRTQLRSTHDLSYSQFRSVLAQAHLLRLKVDPLKYIQDPAQNSKSKVYNHNKFIGLKPLENLNTLLVHTIDHKKNKHSEVMKSNLAHIPAILGAKRSDVVGLWSLRELPNTILESQHAFAIKHNIPLPTSFMISYKELHDSKIELTPKNKKIDKKKMKKFGTNGRELSDALDNLETLYHVEFVKSLTVEQYTALHADITTQIRDQLQSDDNSCVQDQLSPYDLLVEYSTTRPQPRIESILPFLHQPTAQHSQLAPNRFNSSLFEKKKKITRKNTTVPPTSTETNVLQYLQQKKLQTPSITIQSAQSSMVALLSIFSLLPQEILFNNPNSLKISFVGFDYNNTNFVPELIYLCRRLGVNLSLSTPTNSSQFYEMRVFEQSCLSQGKPIPESKSSKATQVKPKPVKRKCGKKLQENLALLDDEIEYSLDEDASSENNDIDLDDSLYDDLVLLEPQLFIQDKEHGLSPHNENFAEIHQYSHHLHASFQSKSNDDNNFSSEISTTAQTPNQTLQSLKSNARKNKKSIQPQVDEKIQPEDHDIKIHPSIVEYIAHPFAAVQLADVIITNSIFPATTHTYYDHPSYVLDKEMCSFAKDTMKIFHVTEGINNWQFPNMGIHDSRCMGAQQIEQENYIIAALASVVLDREVF